MTVRFYSSIAPEVTLSAGVSNVDTILIVSDTAGFPLSTPYTLAVDYGGATEELVQVNSVAGTSLTVTRAIDGTSAASHGAGSKVRHVSSARDFKDSRDHENADNGVHGVTGDVVGTTDTQTLSDKTLTAPIVNGVAQFNGLIDANGGLDLTSGAGVNQLFIKAAPAQSADIADIQNSASTTLLKIDPSGYLDVRAGASIKGGNTLATSGVIIEQGNFVGGTGVLSVRNQSSVALLDVFTTTILAAIPFDSQSVDVSGASLVSAAAGWTIAGNMIATVKNGMITINGNVTRSGANITIDAAGAPSGGIQAMCTIANPYRQRSTLGTMYFHAGNSLATGTLRMASAGGTIELVRWQASQTISTGNTISFTLSYPIT